MERITKPEITALLAAISISSGAVVATTLANCAPAFAEKKSPMYIAEKKKGHHKKGNQKYCGYCNGPVGTCGGYPPAKGGKGHKGAHKGAAPKATQKAPATTPAPADKKPEAPAK